MFESLASCFASRCSAFAQHDIAVYEMSLIHVPAFCPELFACAPYRKCAPQKIEVIKQIEKKHGKPKEKIDKGTTGTGQSFFINEYPATKTYSQWERVAYIQLPKAVAYIVLSSRDEASYRKDAHALREVLKRFTYLEPKTETGAH